MRRPVRGLTTLALTALLLALAPAAARAQPQPAQAQKKVEVPPDGTELFRALLDRAGVKPVRAEEAVNLGGRVGRLDDVIVIVLGDPTPRGNLWLNAPVLAQQVIDSGGAVLIATDTRLTLRRGMWDVVEITGNPVQCGDEKLVHRNFPDCPYVVPVEPGAFADQPGPVWDLFGGREPLRRVATNTPSYLVVNFRRGEVRYPLARFPAGSYALTNRGFRSPLPERAVFAAGADGSDDPDAPGSSYRFLVMADHSVFINQMLLEPGTDNLEFTYRVIDYLQGPTKRKRCVFVENGRVVEHFDDLRQAFAKPQQPVPQINMGAMQEWLVDTSNKLADGIQKDDILDRALDRGFGLPAIARFFLVLGTVFACYFVLRRVWGSRKPNDIPPPPPVAGAPSGPPGVFERRQKELLRRNNVYEPVRDLVREFFASTGVHGEPGPRPPKLVISDMVRKPDSLRAAVRDLWNLAYGPPQVVTVTRWRELEPYFERVRQAHADGKWHFVLPEAPVAATAGSVA